MKWMRFFVVAGAVIMAAVWTVKKLFGRFTLGDLFVMVFVAVSIYVLFVMTGVVARGTKHGQ